MNRISTWLALLTYLAALTAPPATAATNPPPFNLLTNVSGWSYNTGASIITSPALAEDGTIYVISGARLMAFTPEGTNLWISPLASGVRCSHTVGPDGNIYVSTVAKYLQAFSPAGSNLWNFRAPGQIRSTPAVDTNGVVYFGCDNNLLYAVGPGGQFRWAYRTGGDIYAAPSLGVGGDVFVGSQDFGFYRLSSQGQFRAVLFTGNNINGSSAVGADGIVYFGSTGNRFYAVSPTASGTNPAPLWSFQSGRDFRSSPSVANDGTIYMLGASRQLYAFLPTSGKVSWALPIGRASWAGPAIGADGRMYFGTSDRRLYVINQTGQRLTNYLLGGAIYGAPVIGSNGVVYVGGQDRKLYALNIATNAKAHPWPMSRGDSLHTARARFGPLKFTVQPTNTTVRWGQTLTLVAVAGGDLPIAYQWQQNGTPLADQILPVLVITNVTFTNNGSYSLVITNDTGSLTSRTAVVTVNPAAYIVSLATNVPVTLGTTGVLNVVAAGAPTLMYQWRFGGTNLSSAVNASATNASLVLTNVQAGSAGIYRVVVSNAFASVTSAPVTLEIIGAPIITMQPTNVVVYAPGQPIVFQVEAIGLSPLSYQWRHNGTIIPATFNPTATNSTLLFLFGTGLDYGFYDVVITNIAGSVTSKVAQLTNRPLPPLPGLRAALGEAAPRLQELTRPPAAAAPSSSSFPAAAINPRRKTPRPPLVVVGGAGANAVGTRKNVGVPEAVVLSYLTRSKVGNLAIARRSAFLTQIGNRIPVEEGCG